MGARADNSKSPAFFSEPLSRRQFLARAALVAAAPTLTGAFLSACGSSGSAASATSTSPSAAANPTGTAVLMDYPGWIGPSEIPNFQKQYPGAKVRLYTQVPSSLAGYVQIIKNNPGAYDMALADLTQIGSMKAAGVYQAPDWSQIPNIANVDAPYRTAYPDAVPSDYGFVVIGYRKDIVTEPITSWADFWKLAPKYKGRVTLFDIDRSTLGIALKYLGYSDNTTDPAQINKARDALISLKPYLQSVSSVNIGAGLAKGSIVMADCNNYEIAIAQASNKNVAYVVAEEGTSGYFEGFAPIKGSKELDVVNAFLNFSLEAKNYADFVNATGTSWVVPSAEPYIKASIKKSAALQPDKAQLDKVEWLQFVGEATALYSKAWEQFKAA